MASKNKLDIATLASNNGCFDLQFRKDTRHERTNSPTYYRWRVQFIITNPKESVKIIRKVKNKIGCGKVHILKNQARFSVQNINEIVNLVIPYFRKNQLLGSKKRDFELWQKAVNIIYQNKGKYIADWNKSDLLSLVQIHKSSVKYKNNPREPKWISMAQSVIKSI